MSDQPSAGRPVEVFIVLGARDDEDATLVIKAVFSGSQRLGLAQRYQRERGGYIVKALDWENDTA